MREPKRRPRYSGLISMRSGSPGALTTLPMTSPRPLTGMAYSPGPGPACVKPKRLTSVSMTASAPGMRRCRAAKMSPSPIMRPLIWPSLLSTASRPRMIGASERRPKVAFTFSTNSLSHCTAWPTQPPALARSLTRRAAFTAQNSLGFTNW